MKRRITSVALTAMLGLSATVAQNGQFDPYFTTLPTETGKGVVTSLNYYNGGDNWTGFLGIPGAGTTMGKTTWGRFNNPWGGNGRVWIECVDAENSLYVLAAQGHYLQDVTDNGDGTGVSVTGEVGDKANAMKFRIRLKTEEEGVVTANEHPEYEFMTADGKWLLQGVNNRTNNLCFISTTTVDAETGEEVPYVETGSWQIGTWQGVGFARLDVKPWDGPSSGGGVLCADGYYYGTLCLPYEVQIPQGNLFPDSTAIPSISHGDKLVQAWSITDGEDSDELNVTAMKPGDVVPAGSLILVRANNGNVDFLINPGTGYVDKPSDEFLATGYYAQPILEEVFHLHVADGYPKFTRSKMTVNEVYSTPVIFSGYGGNVTATASVIGGTAGGFAQPNVNIGYILSNRSNRAFVEYRLELDETGNGKLKGYENPDYAKLAQGALAGWIADGNLDGAFQIASADTAALAAELRAFVGDKSLEEYEALQALFTSKVIMPDKVYTTLKSGNYMMLGADGLVADYGWPWDMAASRIFLEKVADGQYKIGVNGSWIQDPANVTEEGQVTVGAEAHTFTITPTKPGEILITSGDIALIGDTQVKTGDIKVENEEGEMVYNSQALWTVDNSRPWVQFKAPTLVDGMYYVAVCVPYELGPNPVTNVETGTELEGLDTEFFEVKYNADDELELVRVNTLKAGMPGIIGGSSDFIKVGIVGTDYATAPIAPVGDYALMGVFDQIPAEGQVQNMHVIGAIETTEIVGEDENAEYVTTTKLGLVLGALDATNRDHLNRAYYEGGNNADDIAFVMPEKNWARAAEKELGVFVTEANVGGAFQLPASQAAAFKLQIAQVVDEAGYNAVKEAMIAAVVMPESFYGALKGSGNQYMGDRNQSNAIGLHSNFGTPNGANGRAVMQKVEGGYTLGFNGAYVQAPIDGLQAQLGAEPVAFDITVVAPGQVKISKDGVYLTAAGTLNGGVDGEAAVWSVDNAYTNIIRQDANLAAGELLFGAMTAPFDVEASKANDPAASLWTVAYNAETNQMEMTKVDVLPAGTPGIVAGTVSPVVLNIVGGYALNQPYDASVTGFKGILNIKPEQGVESVNPFFLGVDAEGKLMMTYDGTFDINKMFFEAPVDILDNIPFAYTPNIADDIEEVIVIDQKVLNNNFIYNLKGQRVSEDYKGIVIKNGKKFIQK